MAHKQPLLKIINANGQCYVFIDMPESMAVRWQTVAGELY
jgi:hypothetical protein